jgi:hypothetical protein
MIVKTILAIIAACALGTPVAFAQWSPTSTNTKTVHITPALSETGAVVANYIPGRSLRLAEGKNLRLRKAGAIPSEFKTPGPIRIVDKEGHVLPPSDLKHGTLVHVYYTGAGDHKVVQKIVVDQNIG